MVNLTFITNINSTINLDDMYDEYIVNASGPITITLPNITVDGISLTFRRIDNSNYTVTLQGSSGQTIDGNSSVSLPPNGRYRITSLGNMWYLTLGYPDNPPTPIGGSGYVETCSVGLIRDAVDFGSNNNTAMGTLVYTGPSSLTVKSMSAWIAQQGGTGSVNIFKLAILLPQPESTATIVAITNNITSLPSGLLTLPIESPLGGYTMIPNTLYYLALYNTINGSRIGGIASTPGITNSPLINIMDTSIVPNDPNSPNYFGYEKKVRTSNTQHKTIWIRANIN